MKKLTAIILSVIMLLSVASLVSCAKPTTAAVYTKATEKMLECDAVEMTTSMSIDMSADGQNISLDMDYAIKSKGLKTEAPTAYADIKMTAFGQSVDMTSYMEGNYLYVDSMGAKIKVPKDNEMASIYNVESTIEAFEIDVPLEILEATELATDEDGNYVLSFAFDGAQHADILKKFTDNVMAGINTSLSDYELSIGEVKYDLVIGKDYMLKSMNIELDMDITVEGITMNAAVVAEGKYVAYNDSVIITPPEDYQSYEDLLA